MSRKDEQDDFAIGFDYADGYLKKRKELLRFRIPGKTNKTDRSPIDILQIAIFCNKCGVFMDFVDGGGWVKGKYVCPICDSSVTEENSINAVMDILK